MADPLQPSSSHPLAATSHQAPNLHRRISGNITHTHKSHSQSFVDKTRHTHRQHAAAASTSASTGRSSRLSEGDLLGVGGSGSSRTIKRRDNRERPSSIFSESALAEAEDEHEQEQGPQSRSTSKSRPRSKTYRGESTDSRPLSLSLSHHLDSLSKEELEIVETRFDLMDDDQLSSYLNTLQSNDDNDNDDSQTPSIQIVTPRLPFPSRPTTPTPTPENDNVDKSPLFPPSPPRTNTKAGREKVDHPLRILSRTIRELREVVERLQAENGKLNEEKNTRLLKGNKPADQISIHDGLTEAISTSLTSDSPIQQMHHPINTSQSLHTHSPTPSTRSVRPRSPASSIYVPFPSSPIDTSTSFPSASTSGLSKSMGSGVDFTPMSKRNNRTSWTSGLWVWSASKKVPTPRTRRLSNGSINSVTPTAAGLGTPPISQDQSLSTGEMDDDEAWRKGDGGSSPAYRAIFLATRIITPDPSSILTSTDIPANSLIAYLAHSLVNTARDEGIVATDPPDRRRSKEYSRSRAASIVSQEATSTSQEAKGYGYGDQALAATASLGRTLLSSVSTATSTMRGTKNISHTLNEETRPSLLSRVSSSRGFPTTAISPSPQTDSSTMTTTMTTEEIPPPSVELASIVPDESRPPTVLLSRQNLGSFFQANKVNKVKLHTASRFDTDQPPLTDRYGFIYDIQHAKMLKDASAAGTPAPMSLTGSIPLSNGNSNSNSNIEPEGWIAKQRRGSQGSSRSELKSPRTNDSSSFVESTPMSPGLSIKSVDSGNGKSKKRSTTGLATPPESRSTHTQADHVRHRSSTMLSINPSPAKAVIAKENLTVSARGSSSLQPDASSYSSTSTPLTLSASLTNVNEVSGPSATSTSTSSITASRMTISSLLDQLTEIHDQQQKERLVEWDAFLRKRAKAKGKSIEGGVGVIGISQIGLNGKNGQEDWKLFTKLVRRGIPLNYRSEIWAECSGAKDLIVPGEYHEILSTHAAEENPNLTDIEKDVSRTFPGNVFFGGDGPGVGKLRRVLLAYSWHNPSVGYCQGMNMLAATLLLTHTDEEQAYWVLTSLIDHLLPPNFYSPSLLASRADQIVLEELVKIHLGELSNHLEGLGVELASITFGWFLSLFTDCLPVETLFRVWDVFFVEGHDTLFRVAIAILKLNEQDMIACQSISELFTFISNMTSRLWNADKLISLQHGYKPIIRHIDVVARCEKALASLSQ